MITIAIVLVVAAVIILVERLRPNVVLEYVPYWYVRAITLNTAQAGIAIANVKFLDDLFAEMPLLSLDSWPLVAQILVGYLTITFIYYWWHRARHSIPILWRMLHQVHHSPARIEVITSFYKHPLEMMANGILSSAILYILLGVSAQAAGLTILVTALAELIYHMNIRTPQSMGYVFQRPEMHRIHHQRGLHHYNYSDLPIWDMLFGTYRNPATVNNKTGFPNSGETRIGAMLRFVELES